jgi:dihydrofolate synthase/folylpolyglutamate synthase
VHETVERLTRQSTLEHHTTYFETITAMAFLLFRDAGVEVAVVETGLGGRLDATNVVIPELCVITPIDFDHEALLGNSIESIAAEKAGILKRGVPAVFAPQRRDAERVLLERARDLDVRVVPAPLPQIDRIDRRGSDIAVDGMRVHCPLAGEHQAMNAATAAVALRELGVDPAGIAAAEWPGRLEHVSTRPDVILDGAHNPAGARALAAYIRRFYSDREVWLVFGAMRDKSVQEVTEILFPLARRVILTAPSFARAVRPENMREHVVHENVEIAPDAAAAVRLARTAPATAAVFITGSLYLVGEARALLVE